MGSALMAVIGRSSRADGIAAVESPWRELALSMSCGIIAVDLDGRILFANPPARRILELPVGSAEGLPVAAVLRDHPALRQVLLEAPGLHTLPNRAETEVRFPDGRRRTIGFTATILRNGGGAAIGSAILFKDLTRIERTLEQERLRGRLAALGQMAAGIAHEMRNPLASIQVTATLLHRQLGDSPEALPLIDKIRQEVQRLDRTLVDCLEYAKPRTPNLRPESIPELLAESIRRIRSEHPGSPVRLHLRCAPGLPALAVDRTLILQVLQNLLRNALEALPGRGNVTVEAEVEAHPAEGAAGEEARMLRIAVRDEGPGIPPELHDRVFYPFFTTKKSGCGLGLAEAKKFVEIHGGLVDLDSEPGRGTTFHILLPIPGSGPDSHNPTAGPTPGGKRGRA
ncbi:MAG: PAS domain-containing protein [Acidobacteria bacterium]|nr:PAS domain-containing protein [Acidobacteriota bacterium]